MLAAGRRVAHDFLFPRKASVNSSLSRKRTSLARPYATPAIDELDDQGVQGEGVVARVRRSPPPRRPERETGGGDRRRERVVVGRYGRRLDRYVHVWRRYKVYWPGVDARHVGTGSKEESEAHLTAFDSDKVRAIVSRGEVSALSYRERVEGLCVPGYGQCTGNGHER